MMQNPSRRNQTNTTTYHPVSADPSQAFALGALLAMDEAARMLTRRPGNSDPRLLLRRIFAMLRGRNCSAVGLRDRMEQALGVQLPIAEDGVIEMIEEVHRFKWLEAERAGRDIWRERNPTDPEALALREWFRLYFGAWYLARQTRRFSHT